MTYLLDTSVIIDLLRKKGGIAKFIADHEQDTFTTSAACAFELYSGVYRLPKEERAKRGNDVEGILSSLSEVVPFTTTIAEIAGSLYAQLSKSGTLIDDLDILIAATCLATSATPVTSNTRHFSRISSLPIITV